MKGRLLSAVALIVLLVAGFSFPCEASVCSPVYHVVKPGENLARIARYYGVTVQAIVNANNLWNPNLIYVGQCLLIPVPCQPAPPVGCTTIHIVKRGEYLKIIAARYGTTVSAIVRANGLRNPNLIYPGQRLKIPIKCQPTPQPTPSPGPWKGQYWNNRHLAGAAHFTRNANRVDFNWRTAGPGGGIHYDNFSARWTRTRSFNAGWYRFNIWVDDGVRLWVDGQLLIDQWHDSPPTHYWADKYMSGGNHKLKVEYYEHSGGAQIKLQIDLIQPVPPTPPTPAPPPPGSMWRAEYCSTRIWQECCCPIVRYEPTIYYDWGKGPPFEGFRQDDFAVRWKRNAWFDGGWYRFTITVDDGVILLIDGKPILEKWFDTDGATYVVDQHISRGTHHVEVQYYEATRKAKIQVTWVPFQ